ncbi:kinase-like domain-containing protein [Aspergillus undulatus]|uniref:kinase-like domain-containing protein n=1 Tax=Aspergillus undulatus TaxID=1810928 RepID=UPI003CCCB652
MPGTTTPSQNAEDFGDYVRTEDDEDELEEVVEPWHKYDKYATTNVFYPVYLGEVLNKRYQIEHKLGAGGGSTVWMAHDLQTKTNVAVKVMSLDGWAENEFKMQDEIVRSVQDTSHLVTYLDKFLVTGETSEHRALVMPLAGRCLETYHVQNIPKNNLNERNCMWGLRPIHDLDRTDKYKLLGRPMKQPIPRLDLWKKGELEEFCLGDFGLSKKLSDPNTPRGYPPLEYCSPDRLHRKVPSRACDMWSYMVVFSVLYMRFCPFPSPPFPGWWDPLDYWYDQSQIHDLGYDLASRIAYFSPQSDPDEREHVRSIMSKVFTYDPEKRPTASQLLRDPDFRAIMDKYGC